MATRRRQSESDWNIDKFDSHMTARTCCGEQNGFITAAAGAPTWNGRPTIGQAWARAELCTSLCRTDKPGDSAGRAREEFPE